MKQTTKVILSVTMWDAWQTQSMQWLSGLNATKK